MAREWETFIAGALDDMGVRYKREVGFGVYRADFVLVGRDVVLEIDGPSHEGTVLQRRRDNEKDDIYRSCGFVVMRIKECDLEVDWQSVLRDLRQYIRKIDKELFHYQQKPAHERTHFTKSIV